MCPHQYKVNIIIMRKRTKQAFFTKCRSKKASNFHLINILYMVGGGIKRNVLLFANLQYRNSIYSFRGNYSFLILEIVSNSNSFINISIFYLINWIFAAETIQGRKLHEEIQYLILDVRA